MSRKRKVVIDKDGTPVETDEIIDDGVTVEPTSNDVLVYWTKLGEERGAFSEHGAHQAGDKVMTAYAPQLVKAGFATFEAPEASGQGGE